MVLKNPEPSVTTPFYLSGQLKCQKKGAGAFATTVLQSAFAVTFAMPHPKVLEIAKVLFLRSL